MFAKPLEHPTVGAWKLMHLFRKRRCNMQEKNGQRRSRAAGAMPYL